MHYLGGKYRVSKQLTDFMRPLLSGPYAEPFCGSCWVASSMGAPEMLLSDKHPYLIAMWQALQSGWEPPSEVSEEEYYDVKRNMDREPHLTGFIGFGCSYAGKWFGGYARGGNANYALQAKNSLSRKIKQIQSARFVCCGYEGAEAYYNKPHLIYCDPPYAGSTGYGSVVGKFDNKAFNDWMRDMSRRHLVLCSEYERNVPSDARVAWRTESRRVIRGKSGRVPTAEVLYTFNSKDDV